MYISRHFSRLSEKMGELLALGIVCASVERNSSSKVIITRYYVGLFVGMFVLLRAMFVLSNISVTGLQTGHTGGFTCLYLYVH
jgi:hypothetical protein